MAQKRRRKNNGPSKGLIIGLVIILVCILGALGHSAKKSAANTAATSALSQSTVSGNTTGTGAAASGNTAASGSGTTAASPAASLTDSGLTANYIDVGQGDSEFIYSQGGTLLIDAGTADGGKNVVAYLKSLGVTEINCVIATHPHADHIGGMPEVFSNFQVDNVIIPDIDDKNTPDTDTYADFLDAVDKEGCTMETAVPGSTGTYGGISFTELGPIQQNDDYNNMSVVIRVTYGSSRFLFVGDCSSDEEKDLLSSGRDLSADVLKVGHHGSSTSSTESFLNAVKPSLAVISVGEGNSYNHPAQTTLDKLSSLGIKILRTDKCGSIIVKTDGTNISYTQQKES